MIIAGFVGHAVVAGLGEEKREQTCDGDDALHSGSKNVWCSGCWEELPDVCGCDVSRWCFGCATVSARWSAVPAYDFADVALDGGVEDSACDASADGHGTGRFQDVAVIATDNGDETSVQSMVSLSIIDGVDDVFKDEADEGSDSGFEVGAKEIDAMVRRARKLGCSSEEVANAEHFNDIGLEQKRALLLKLWPRLSIRELC